MTSVDHGYGYGYIRLNPRPVPVNPYPYGYGSRPAPVIHGFTPEIPGYPWNSQYPRVQLIS